MSELREELHGPAFACAAENGHQPGMSIRTYIATEAMAALISIPADYENRSCTGTAREAVQYADALIAALSARKEK